VLLSVGIRLCLKICTCRPYLVFGVEEAVKEAQRGGSGVVILFRKEGRALGEVTKYLVYNARKRGADRELMVCFVWSPKL